MILVDTNVWLDFLHQPSLAEGLDSLLKQDRILGHPWVIAEIALGNLGSRRLPLLFDLWSLQRATVIEVPELIKFVEERHLYGQGLSMTDVQLLASSLVEDSQLWTHDKKLRQAADKIGCCYHPKSN